jgi:DNA-binding Lrp family transcriptional regulator
MGSVKLTGKDKQMIRQIQGDLPVVRKPFALVARQAGWEEKAFLRRIRFFLQRGIIRRFGAILRHQIAGYRGNAMVVWKVAEERTAKIGPIMASFPAVSHCYLRPAVPEWPFNLYTMIHGRSHRDCRTEARAISRKTGIKDYRLLFSKRELKKSSMQYFELPQRSVRRIPRKGAHENR